MGGGSFTTPRGGHQHATSGSPAARTTPSCTPRCWAGRAARCTSRPSARTGSTWARWRRCSCSARPPGPHTDLPDRTQDGSGLHITMPSSNPPFAALAYVVKLTFSGRIPTPGSGPLPDRLGPDRQRHHRPGARQRRQRRGRLGAQAVELRRQHQPAVAARGRWAAATTGSSTAPTGWSPTAAATAANGANAVQSAWTGGNNQQWRLNSLGNGRYQIVNRGTGTALDGAGNAHRRARRWSCGRRTAAPTTSGPSPASDRPKAPALSE